MSNFKYILSRLVEGKTVEPVGKHGPKYTAYLKRAADHEDEYYGSGYSRALRDYLSMPEEDYDTVHKKKERVKGTYRFIKDDDNTSQEDKDAHYEEWQRLDKLEDEFLAKENHK